MEGNKKEEEEEAKEARREKQNTRQSFENFMAEVWVS